MSLIYSVVAKGEIILSEYTDYRGNFEQVSLGLLKKVQKNTRAVFSYEDKFFFHYCNENGITYMCMREAQFPSDTADSFVEGLKTDFTLIPQSTIDNANSYGLNDIFREKMKSKIEYFNTNKSNPNDDHIERLKQGLINTKNQVIDTAEVLSDRGDKINLIVKKADSLSQDSRGFYSGAKNVRLAAQRRKIMITVALVVVCLLVIYLILGWACGFKFEKC